MIIKHKYLLFFLILSLFACATDTPSVEPPVDDDNEAVVVNNTRLDAATTLYGLITDKQGNAVANVVVTDGFTTSKTDQNGVYQLVRNRRAKFVYYSTPADCKIVVDGSNHPKFYEPLTSKDKLIRHDFTVEKQPVENEFTLFCVSDPQCRNENELNRYKFETIPDINREAARFDHVYAITLGDIIFDSPALWSAMKSSMAGQAVPFFQTIGNHDHLETAENEEKAVEGFQQQFGPTDYSFNRGDVHIISMDNVIYTGKQQYTGGFTDNQWKWLQEDLSHVSKEKMVILNTHIPFRAGGSSDHRSYHAEVLQLLSTYAEAHIMIGHTHYQINYLHKVNGKTVYEHVHGAACGAWWNSEWCADGTPNGYGVYEIEGNGMKNWYYKGTNEPADFQMRAYDATKVFGPAGKYTYAFAPNLSLTGDGWIVANIWNADENWDVKLFQDGVEIGTMTQRSSKDYWVLYHHLELLSKAVGSTFDKSSNHFYLGRLNGKASDANFRIEARDPFGNVYTTSELY